MFIDPRIEFIIGGLVFYFLIFNRLVPEEKQKAKKVITTGVPVSKPLFKIEKIIEGFFKMIEYAFGNITNIFDLLWKMWIIILPIYILYTLGIIL